jgi:hypothetical protein
MMVDSVGTQIAQVLINSPEIFLITEKVQRGLVSKIIQEGHVDLNWRNILILDVGVTSTKYMPQNIPLLVETVENCFPLRQDVVD